MSDIVVDTTNGATKGVQFTNRFNCPFVLLEVPVGTKEGDEVVASNPEGKTYGPYRVAHLAAPGDNAITTFAMAWKVPKARKAANAPRGGASEMMAQMVAMQQAAMAQQADLARQNAELIAALLAKK